MVAAVLAGALAGRHRVTLVHHHPGLSADQLGERFGVDATGVGLWYAPSPGGPWQASGNPFRLRPELAAWKADFSRGFDRFVWLGHGAPPVCHAAAGATVVLFPSLDTRSGWPFAGGGLKAWPRRVLHRHLWRDRLASYTTHIAISEYTAGWVRRRWGVSPAVVHPPMPDVPQPGEKQNLVAAVGRFAPMKRQDELVKQFVAMNLPGWRFDCVGGLSDRPAEQAVFDAAVGSANDSVAVRANRPRPEVLGTLAAAKVFWHAAGVGLTDADDPEAAEHFGIAPAEAMSAGCVPLVADRGGPAEVVAHGDTGFLCRTLDDFAGYTRELAADEPKRQRMGAAARASSRRFTRDVFLRNLQRALSEVLPPGWAAP